MGDRNNLIKFGPEWMRNLTSENTATSRDGVGGGPGGPGPSAAAGPNTHSSKVQLAKLRYGREEMLALYDSNVSSPAELKIFDLLYNPRGKPPIALNNTFEEEVRDNMRSGPTMPSMDRYAGRGADNRGAVVVMEGRGRGRSVPFVRQTSTGRGGFVKPGGPLVHDRGGEEAPFDSQAGPSRSWGNNGNNPQNRNGGPDKNTEWNTAFKKWQGNSNWRRQPGREEGEEWRNPESTRSRPAERGDWGDRSERGRERLTSWNSNRRHWSNDSQNDDNLPEWAVDNTEACGGTFDSSGAFHGYSNDDSTIPNKPDPMTNTVNPLARSQTAGNFVKPKPGEQGSEEWWASDKAKKLSPKLFSNLGDAKFNKKRSQSTNNTSLPNQEAGASAQQAPSAFDEPTPNKRETDNDKNNKNEKARKVSFNLEVFEGKTFDSLMRSDINAEEANDEAGNFQSVMITPNNSLRTRHQHMVPTAGARDPPPAAQPAAPAGPPPQPSQPPQNNISDSKPVQSINKSANNQKNVESIDNFIEMSFNDLHMNDIPLPPHPPPNVSNAAMMGMGISSAGNTMGTNVGMQLGMSNSAFSKPVGNTPHSMQSSVPNMSNSGMTHGNQGMDMQMGPGANSRMTIPLSSIPTPVITTSRMSNSGMGVPGARGPAPNSYPSGGGDNSAVNASLFMGQNGNNGHGGMSQQMAGEMGGARFPMHGMQQGGYGAAAMYGAVMSSRPPAPQPVPLVDQLWYYEDPAKNIQGPFSSKEMYNWYTAGFFTSDLMVRRACDAHMRPLGTYGAVVPFADVLTYPLAGGFDPRAQAPRESMLNAQQSMALGDMMNMSNMSELSMDTLEFGSVGNSFIRNPSMPPINVPQDPLWSQPAPAIDMWIPEPASRPDPRPDDITSFFWDQQPNAMTTKSMLPEEIVKGMQTEDQILAQLRAAQAAKNAEQAAAAVAAAAAAAAAASAAPQPLFSGQEAPVQPEPITAAKTRAPSSAPAPAPAPPLTPAPAAAAPSVTPDLGELQKLIQKDTLVSANENKPTTERKVEASKVDTASKPASSQNKEAKKSVKTDVDKSAKKESNGKKKKNKEDKTEESEVKKEEESKVEKSEETSTKSKKEDKISKKELEKEKKEWLKDGFTIVKGPEKVSKESKKKSDEAKPAEDEERKRKEEEKLAAAEEDKQRKQGEVTRRQQLSTAEPAVRETAPRRAPWSGVGAAGADLPLADIQRLEREKKLEQIKEQQQMMQLIAQQQQAQLAREQEMQAGLGWHKKKGVTMNITESLAEIQAEARKQAAAAAAATAAAVAAEQAALPPQPVNIVPWAKSPNGGFWETERTAPAAKVEPPKPEPAKPRKKQPAAAPAPPPAQKKREVSPAVEFEGWCTSALTSWTTKIDVPTFVGFLKDIESPYEVKDYVKCYLGETKDANEFAKQFLERRSKMWRASAVTHSDDLSHPAPAVIPRAPAAGSEYYLDPKNKVKKTKKNKMQKVDARFLGFSTTASEDRINVGDIDTV